MEIHLKFTNSASIIMTCFHFSGTRGTDGQFGRSSGHKYSARFSCFNSDKICTDSPLRNASCSTDATVICGKRLTVFFSLCFHGNMYDTLFLWRYPCWLVGCIEDLRRFSGISAISRLGSRRYPISEIQMARPGIEPRTSCSESQELNHSATTAPDNISW